MSLEKQGTENCCGKRMKKGKKNGKIINLQYTLIKKSFHNNRVLSKST